ncbi:hypothetical protein LXL04_027904 [Taraxacum kok-saghyz]
MFAASLLLQSFVLLGSLRHRFRECLDPFDVHECEAFDICFYESLMSLFMCKDSTSCLHIQFFNRDCICNVSSFLKQLAKDLFEDVAEELETKYHYDKTRVKDAMKTKKVSVAPTWTFSDFKDAMQDDIITPPLSDTNFQLVFEDLLKRAKEKEKKEQKRRRRFAKDFTELLDNIKEINESSTWEDCKQLFEESNVYR